MPEQSPPHVDPYPEPVALTALDLARVQRIQVEQGRAARLRRLARHNPDVAWLLHQVTSPAASPAPAKPAGKK